MNEIRPIPDSPQERFIKSNIRELGYGGQAGGGKSFALILDVLHQLGKPGYDAILFRRTYKQLMEAGGLIDYSQQIYPSLGGIFNQSNYTWKFPGYHGNTIRFSHIEREADIEQHSGSAYGYIGFDELETFTERQYLFLFSRNRATNPAINLYVRSTFNPGGIGHHWIKKRFIEPFKNSDRPKWFKRVNGLDTETGKDDPLAISRFFIPSRLEDNPYLWRDGDSEYERNLHQLDTVDFRRLRLGDWDIRRTGRVYHAFTGPGPDAAALDYSKAAGYWHSHDFGAVNAVWGLWCKIENVYYLIWEQQLPEGTTASRAAIIKARLDGLNVVAGFGGAKGEEQQRLDFLREGVKIRLPVITDVEGQVDAANRMLENGTMVICSNCVHTIDQMENCVRDEKEGIAEKSTWHYCFIAGTLISTSEGLKPIEQMRVGDLVKTRKGYRKVTATGFRSKEQVMTVRFSNGLQLTGTLDHPVFVQNVPTRLDVLRYGDIISLDDNYFKELYQWLQKIEKPLSFKEKPIIDTLMREIYQTEDTLGIKASTFIELFGNRIMAQFRKAIRFTTRIETRPITTLVTWQWLKQVSTLENTTSQRASDSNNLDNRPSELGPLQLNGINQKPADNGIVSNQKRIGSTRTSVDKSRNQDNIPVSIVGGYSTAEAYRLIKSSFARMGVSHLTVESPVLITKQESVSSASNPLRPTNTVELDSAHVTVSTRRGLGDVFNLTVEGEHEYFANGVLVANCDMTRYFAAGVKRGVFVG